MGFLDFVGGVTNAAANVAISQEQNRINKEIAEKNLAFQKENFDYQKALQEEIFNREDTSYQRTVEDMRNAGLNPMAMNGTNGTGEAIATTPMENTFQQDNSGLYNMVQNTIDTMDKLQNYETGEDFKREQKAKADKAETDARIANVQQTLDEATLRDKIKLSNLSREEKEKLMKDLDRNMEYNESKNLFNGMPEDEREARIISGVKTNNNPEEADIERKTLARTKYGILKGLPEVTSADAERTANKAKKQKEAEKAKKQAEKEAKKQAKKAKKQK